MANNTLKNDKLINNVYIIKNKINKLIKKVFHLNKIIEEKTRIKKKNKYLILYDEIP